MQGPLNNFSTSPQTIQAPLVLTGENLPVNTLGNLTLNGAISGSGTSYGIVKSGSGTLYLAGSNTYSGGTTINAGNLVFASLASVPASGKILIQSGAALNATGAYSTVQAWLASGTIDPSSSGAIAVSGAPGTPGLDNENTNFTGYNSLCLGAVAGGATYSGTITPAGNTYRLGGGGPLTVTAGLSDAAGTALLVSGNVTLTASNTYTGSTTILARGTLEFGQRAALYNSSTSSWTAGNIVVGSGATLTLAVGGSNQFTAADVQALAGPGTFDGRLPKRVGVGPGHQRRELRLSQRAGQSQQRRQRAGPGQNGFQYAEPQRGQHLHRPDVDYCRGDRFGECPGPAEQHRDGWFRAPGTPGSA